MQSFDVVVIGSGPGGYRAAVLAALRNLKVAIIEKAQWGGCCLNRGCVPKKAWHHSAQLVAQSKSFAQRGITGTLSADLAQAWQHQHGVVEKVRDSYIDYMKRLGITALNGAARFESADTLAIGDARVRAKHVIIATGSSPSIPAPFALSRRVITTDQLFDLMPLPGRRIAVIGSGVIGTEFAFILTKLGCSVLWLSQGKPLGRARYSAPALKALYDVLARQDVVASTGQRVQAILESQDTVTLTLTDGRTEVVDWVLLGTGRAPHTAELCLENTNIEVDENGFIVVDEYLHTANPTIYAIGDVCNPRMTANHALADAGIAVSNILTPDSRKRDLNAVPELVYSAVELGRIGLTEDEAEDEDLEPAVGFAAFETNPRALGQGDSDGFVRLVADMDTGRLLGAELVGAEVGEVIETVALRFGHDDILNTFAHAYYNHPARAEEILNATETLAAKWGLSAHIFGKD